MPRSGTRARGRPSADTLRPRYAPGAMTGAMILAAGLGTRLLPLTEELPKPLVPLGDGPLVTHAAARLAGAGLAPLVMNTHHLAPAFAHAGLDALGVRVVHEPRILGTAG